MEITIAYFMKLCVHVCFVGCEYVCVTIIVGYGPACLPKNIMRSKLDLIQ